MMVLPNRLLHIVATRMFTTLDKTHDVEFLQKRLMLFETFTLPSLASQTNKNFYWILLVSDKLPIIILNQLNKLVKPYANFFIIQLSVADLHDQPEYEIKCTEFIKQHNLYYNFLLSSRIDGDDAWSVDYVDTIQKESMQQIEKYNKWKLKTGLIMSFTHGEVCYPYNIRGKEGIGKWKRKFFSQSVDVLTLKSKKETVYKFPHSKSAQYAKDNNYQTVFIQTRNPMWLYVQHQHNDGLLRAWHRWFLLFEKFLMQFHGFMPGNLERYGLTLSVLCVFRKKYLKLKPLNIFAHRGYHNSEVLENSELAILNAIEHNCYGIEVDVQLTKDNQLIIFHDYDLERLFGIKKMISDISFSELSNFKTSKRGKVITLNELLLLVPDNIIINLELKSQKLIFNSELVKSVADIVKLYPNKNIFISSFNICLLMQYQLIDQSRKKALLLGVKIPLLKQIIFCSRINLDAIHIHKKFIGTTYWKQVEGLNYKMRVYTINDVFQYQQLQQYAIVDVFSDSLLGNQSIC